MKSSLHLSHYIMWEVAQLHNVVSSVCIVLNSKAIITVRHRFSKQSVRKKANIIETRKYDQSICYCCQPSKLCSVLFYGFYFTFCYSSYKKFKQFWYRNWQNNFIIVVYLSTCVIELCHVMYPIKNVSIITINSIESMEVTLEMNFVVWKSFGFIVILGGIIILSEKLRIL